MTRFEALVAIRARKPLLHCISNLVTANDCANLALAVGASPIMAQAPQEMDDIAAQSRRRFALSPATSKSRASAGSCAKSER